MLKTNLKGLEIKAMFFNHHFFCPHMTHIRQSKDAVSKSWCCWWDRKCAMKKKIEKKLQRFMEILSSYLLKPSTPSNDRRQLDTVFPSHHHGVTLCRVSPWRFPNSELSPLTGVRRNWDAEAKLSLRTVTGQTEMSKEDEWGSFQKRNYVRQNERGRVMLMMVNTDIND